MNTEHFHCGGGWLRARGLGRRMGGRRDGRRAGGDHRRDLHRRTEPGVGFNDPTPAAPVGGNAGTTLGEQRQHRVRARGQFWGSQAALRRADPVLARFAPLECTATAGVLGSAGAWNVFSDFPNGRPGTWYPAALANKLAGVRLFRRPRLPQSADLRASFNGDLGKPGLPRRLELLPRPRRQGRSGDADRPADDGAARVRPRPGLPDLHRRRSDRPVLPLRVRSRTAAAVDLGLLPVRSEAAQELGADDRRRARGLGASRRATWCGAASR